MNDRDALALAYTSKFMSLMAEMPAGSMKITRFDIEEAYKQGFEAAQRVQNRESPNLNWAIHHSTDGSVLKLGV